MLEKGERDYRNTKESTWRTRGSRVKEGVVGARSEKYFENLDEGKGTDTEEE